MSDTFFKNIHISNFKSLKDVTLNDCKRINLLIGKPNVGKSNILEAIGLFSLPYFDITERKKLTDYVRLESFAQLFFDGNTEENIIIETNDGRKCVVKYMNETFVEYEDKKQFIPVTHLGFNISLKKNKSVLHSSFFYDNHIKVYNDIPTGFDISVPFSTSLDSRSYWSLLVKLYKFKDSLLQNKAVGYTFLMPPDGINLLEAIEKNKLSKELSKLFDEYGLTLLLDRVNNTIRVMKTLKEENTMISFPYSSIADTLQRVIFYKTAIASNKNSILLFEEPEAHCFPPYITHIAKEIIDSETNQFFIATHSPFILDTFLENARNDLAIYIADFKNGQTVIKRLTDNEVDDVFNYGLDLFFNAELFTDEI